MSQNATNQSDDEKVLEVLMRLHKFQRPKYGKDDWTYDQIIEHLAVMEQIRERFKT